jgi:hypothetical protein
MALARLLPVLIIPAPPRSWRWPVCFLCSSSLPPSLRSWRPWRCAGGFLWAKSTASLLNVCSTDNEICTGFLEQDTDAHLKRLQAPSESAYFEFRSVTLPPPPPPSFK